MAKSKIHAAMFPWLAMGHMIPFLQLSNKLAERGYRVSFLIPTKTLDKLHHLNLHPDLIQFIPITIPHVPGLPLGAETMTDVSLRESRFLGSAFDRTQQEVNANLHQLQPDVVFFDFAHWLPDIAHPLGSKCIYISVSTAAAIASTFVPARKLEKGKQFTVEELMKHAPGFPSSSNLEILPFEARRKVGLSLEFGDGISFYHRLTTSMTKSDGICFRGCREIDGKFSDYVENQYKKPVILLGPNLPEESDSMEPLEESWAKWLSGFDKGSVVYCAFGSECVLEKDQFHELVLGLELTGYPFLARLKPPFGAETVEEGLPEGFEERVKGKGVVTGGWVQQQQILKHPSVGCFVSHAGPASMWESLTSNCQMVLVPHMGDQFLNTKFMSKEFKLAVAVEREPKDAKFSREGVYKAVKLVMDEGSEVGEEVKANHLKWRDFLSAKSLTSTYMSNFFTKLGDIIIS